MIATINQGAHAMRTESILAGSIVNKLEETVRFVRRCESNLRIARNVGSVAWKVEGLEEVLVDARQELADLKRFGV